ncbi:class I adenylate-forming enzyme family protein [Novosphingobium colocasiae]
MMSQFWNDPEASAERMVDGWIKTGDIGRIDINGYVYLIDRAADTIISGGYNIYPGEIERVIANDPRVTEVAVFGVPHARWGESPMALCVLAAGAEMAERDVIDLVARELGGYQKPSRVEFSRAPLPRSAVGKINRKQLREPYWQGAGRRVAGS